MLTHLTRIGYQMEIMYQTPVDQVSSNLLINNSFYLRKIVIHGAENIPPWYILLDYFTTRPSFKNLNVAFLTKWS